MLSLSNLSGGHAASGYYRSEGYYIAGSPEGQKSTEYFGKAAEEAGLTGVVNDDAFAKLLEGEAPDGRLMGRYRNGERQHRAGMDLTFSAPKGVSIAALVAGDGDVFKAHKQAVIAAMEFVEKHIAQYRTVVGGVTEAHTGGKLIAGMFHHDTSRALDPQLHTHVVIANMVKGEDGQFRALHNDQILNLKMTLGQVYRNELAQNLERAGFDVERQQNNLLDIKGIPAALSDTFSKRRAEILSALKDRDRAPNAKSSALAALATRASKNPIERSELHNAWMAETTALGIDAKALVESLKTRDLSRTPHGPEEQRALTHRAVDFAISHLAERLAVYSQGDLLRTALAYDANLKPEAVWSEINTLVSEKILHPVMRGNKLHYTDQENVRLESENLRMMRNANRHAAKIDVRRPFEKALRVLSDTALETRLFKLSLSDGQKEAVSMSLSAKEGKIVGVQGLAGTGKTYMMATVSKIAETRGYAIEGMAVSGEAVKALSEAVPNSRTLESALTKFDSGGKEGDKTSTILVVDEASMLSSDNMNRTLRMAAGRGYARVILMGDVKQLDAVGAGSAFRLLQERGLPTAVMTDIQRQNTQEGRDAVIAAVAGDIHKAMEGIATITETGQDGDKRQLIGQELAERFVALSSSEREKTAVIVMTNNMRTTVNDAVQTALKDQRVLRGTATTLNTLDPLNFTTAEASEIRSYQRGQIVLAPVAHKTSGLVTNVLYTVSDIDPQNERLILSDETAETVTLDLKPGSRIGQKLAVFEQAESTLHQGDSVKFKITDKDRSIQNATRGTVISASGNGVEIRTEEGEYKSLPADSLAVKGMQLAYADTAHGFQGKTVDRVLMGMVSDEVLATQKGFYVALSRMRDETHLVTDNASELSQQIEAKTGERVNALDALDYENPERQDRENPARETTKTEPAKGSDERLNSNEQEPSQERQMSFGDMSKIDEKLAEMERINERLSQSFERPEKTR